MAHKEIEIISQAMGLREMIGLSEIDAINNIDEKVVQCGYKLAEESLGHNYAAYCVPLENELFAIVLNNDQMWNQNFRRFTIAHEMGHLNLTQHRAALQRGDLQKSQPEFQSVNRIEREADYFAISFLAPKQAFEDKAKFKSFNFDSLLEIGEYFGISILASAFRFVELTDLICSLIVIDGNTGEIRYEKRSQGFQNLGYAEYLYEKKVPTGTNAFDVLNFPKSQQYFTDYVNLIDWYSDLLKEVGCTESIMYFDYNNSLVVLLDLNDNPDIY